MIISEGGDFSVRRYQKDNEGQMLTCYQITNGKDSIWMTGLDFKIFMCVVKIAELKEEME